MPQDVNPHNYSDDHPMLAKGIGFQFAIALFGMVMLLLPNPLTELIGTIALIMAVYLYEVERREWRRHTGAENAEQIPFPKTTRKL